MLHLERRGDLIHFFARFHKLVGFNHVLFERSAERWRRRKVEWMVTRGAAFDATNGH
jgi:hypothetical protein